MGATIGTREFTRNYVGAKVSEWSSEVLLLAKIAESQPQAAYSALTHGLFSRWRFVARTIPQGVLTLRKCDSVYSFATAGRDLPSKRFQDS